jgi:soluble epoxide hydrolase/lipid-phosphate phosphatase
LNHWLQYGPPYLVTMAPAPLSPSDPRAIHKHTTIPGTGLTYHYLLCRPNRPPRATILLLHGFPDLALGWRYQVPYLLDVLNLQVIVPDMLGYDRTSRPAAVDSYTCKNLSAHMAHLIHEVVGPGQQVFLGGHDWGGYLAWRLAMWHPDLIRGK